MTDKAIGIAMSGGVDSTACGLLLKEKNEYHRIEGFFMNLNQPDYDKQRDRVEAIADQLNLKLTIIDLRRDFEKYVLKYFSESYFTGQTPNPCVICNQEIKFGLFLQEILSRGMDIMATGHYAQIRCADDKYHLHMGKDPKKDQSYFLSRLTQKQLSKVVFPLGSSSKDDIYTFVETHGFHHFRGQESQDVCFLENNQVNNFLQNRHPQTDNDGPILSTSGKKLGTHKGLFRYTIGQRRGLGISSETPLYVIRLVTDRNAVIVGQDKELFRKELYMDRAHWLCGTAPDPKQTYSVRIRYTHRGAAARLALQDNKIRVTFREPQRAITPGQFGAVYLEDELLGSGVIL